LSLQGAVAVSDSVAVLALLLRIDAASVVVVVVHRADVVGSDPRVANSLVSVTRDDADNDYFVGSSSLFGCR
jgi:hypothetical protein